jgi:regulatory protein
MKIKITSVSALSEGAEVILTLSIDGGEGRVEKRKLLIFTEQYLELGLKKGDEIDETCFDELERMSRTCRAIKKGRDLLSYSASSKVRLASRLRAKGIDPESAKEASERLSRIGAINEKSDVEILVQKCLKKLWGRRRIVSDLCSKGYPRDIVISEVAEISEDEIISNCAILIKKKYGKVSSDPEERKKMIASLVRYGYTFSEITRAIDR